DSGAVLLLAQLGESNRCSASLDYYLNSGFRTEGLEEALAHRKFPWPRIGVDGDAVLSLSPAGHGDRQDASRNRGKKSRMAGTARMQAYSVLNKHFFHMDKFPLAKLLAQRDLAAGS